MPKFFKKLVLSVLASMVLLTSLAPAAMAQTAAAPTKPWFSTDFQSWYAKVYGGDQSQIFGERYTAAQVQWVFYGFGAMILNAILNSSGKCSSAQLADLFGGNVGGASCLLADDSVPVSPVANGPKTNILSEIFADRPLSGITYFKDIARKFHIIPEAHAQSVGFGYQALQPVQSLWQAARNVSYGLFVFVILIMAFMIMFRVKISPQVVISVQSALPKIAIALILVTFSYAIAGLLIDLMYVVIGLISLIFASTGLITAFGAHDPVTLFNILTRGFPIGAANSSIVTGIWGFLFLYLVQFIVTLVLVGIGLGFGLVPGIGTGAALAVGTVSGVLFGFIAIIVAIIMIFILLWMGIKILWTLIKAFAFILFLTIVLPLQVTLGVVVPGIGFNTWVKQFAANLAVFPVTGVLFMLAFIFLEEARQFVANIIHTSALSGYVKVPVGVSTLGWPPLLGTGTGTIALVYLGASFFVLTLIPKAAQVVSALITGKGDFGNAIGEAIGGPVGIGKGLAGGAASERLQRFQNANKDQTAFQNVRDTASGGGARSRATAEYILAELTRRLTGGR